MGHLLRKTGKAEESLPHLKKALEHDQSNFQYHLEYGRSLVAVNRNDEGVEHMIKATNLNPAPTTFAELARTARESGNPYFAIKAFRKILRVRPNNSAVINQYAGLLQETGMYFPAIDQYVKLLKKNPNDAEILYNIGLCYQGYGKVNRMKQYFSKAAKVKPDWFEPRYSLGSIAVFQKEWTPAKIHLSTAHKLKPDHAPTIILLATVYMETQQYSKVTNLLDKFLETNPEHREAHLICGQANAFQVKTAKAKQHFETFLKLEPLQSPRRREVMKFLDQTK
jgi:tetratricopeptide (TPR) repeat protein